MAAPRKKKPGTEPSVEELKNRLREAEETLEAIRSGAVDAVMVYGAAGERVYSLQGTEYPYRVFLETMNEGAVTINEEGIILFCNTVFSNLLKREAETIIGTHLRDCVDCTPTPFDEFLRESLRGPTRRECLVSSANREHIPVLVSTNILQILETRDLCLVFTDLTERKKAEYELKKSYDELELRVRERTADLNEANANLKREIEQRKQTEKNLVERKAELERANAELDSYAYSISHDLRSPLRAVSGFATILLEDFASSINDEGKDYLTRISKNTDTMSNLIDALLRFSRVGRQEIQITQIDMGKISEEAEKEAALHPARKACQVRIESLPPAQGDPALIRQVLINLLTNAAKYGKENETNLIEVGAIPGKEQHTYFVRDHGIGFDMAFVDKIFGVFQQLQARSREGTGVGLAIARRIVERHGGRIWAESKPGEGATFYFTLPAVANQK